MKATIVLDNNRSVFAAHALPPSRVGISVDSCLDLYHNMRSGTVIYLDHYDPHEAKHRHQFSVGTERGGWGRYGGYVGRGMTTHPDDFSVMSFRGVRTTTGCARWQNGVWCTKAAVHR